MPHAWLLAPALEVLAGAVCAALVGLSHAGGRLRERALVGVYALTQTVCTIVVTLDAALLPPQTSAAANAWRCERSQTDLTIGLREK